MTFPSDDLLDWYDRHRRIMPWRSLPGQSPQPYHVWLSEIMLQQTTVATVHGYYARFLARFPHIEDLAAAPQEDVLTAWSGLGYYSRARNLHLGAQEIVRRGGFPDDVPGLLTLPGIGPYTARAIAAIAFGIPVVPVDGNVERVVARLHAVNEPLPQSKKHLAALAGDLNRDPSAMARASDFAQALFDLGATICTPRVPKCMMCPWRPHCAAFGEGDVTRYPVRAPKRKRPVCAGASWIVTGPEGQVWLRRRPKKGLLAGMVELPGTAWTPVAAPVETPPPQMPGRSWTHHGQIKHVFTHLTLHLDIYQTSISSWDVLATPMFQALLDQGEGTRGFACAVTDFDQHALSSLTRKSLARARM